MSIERGKEDMENNIEILYEDSDVCVVNKPAGLIVHSDGRTEEPSLAEWFLSKYPESRDVGDPWVSPQGETILRPGIVHRLDRTTSGVMILAKTKSAHEFLKLQFQDRSTKKEYKAFVYGCPKEKSGVIEAEIVRIRSKPPRWGVERKNESKKHREAITNWEVLSCGVDKKTDTPVAVLSVKPKTGRTHQIRVHLKHLGYPVLCDHLYAKTKPCILGFDRPALHAFRLSIDLPTVGRKTFEADLPEDFEFAIKELG